MLKRFVVTLIVATFIFPGASATAAMKPGSKCANLKATTTVSGIKYTCIKSGVKLVWNKGVKVKVALKAGVCPKQLTADATTGITTVRANSLVSMTELEGENCANILGWQFRIMEKDGEIFVGTFDYRTDRVNVKLVKDVIVKVNVG